MTRKIMARLLCFILIGLVPAVNVYAGPPGPPPDGPDGPNGPNDPANITWEGAATITSGTTESDKTFTSDTADQNAVLIDTADAVTLKDPTVTKSGGNSASDSYSFYGINSAVMVKGGTTTTISGGTVTTDAAGANGVFSYGANNGTTNAAGDGTTVNISGTKITTTGDGSGGIMTTYGGTTIASDLTVTTSGRSSAPIRTDRGGGWVTVSGGTYTSNGLGSPAIYSTAEVKVSNAKLVSNRSEGVCIEGTGSIELTDCDLTADNNGLNGNATFYDTIMIYQSQSGDASNGTSSFTMTGGSLTSKNGDTFHVTNTTAVINLSGVAITNSSDDVLISVCDDGWSGASNVATLNATDQILAGDVLVGSGSTLTMKLSGSSKLTGRTDGNITDDKGTVRSTSVGTINMTIGSGCTWELTGDSYVTTLTCDGNIKLNGHKLYVNGEEYQEGEEQEEEEQKDAKSIENATVSGISNKAYTGKAIKPAPKVVLDGTTLRKGTDYTLRYKNNKKIGTATVTITGKGDYTGKISRTFKIVPTKTSVKAVKNLGSNKIKVTWKKNTTGSGYQIQYATDSDFSKNVKKITVGKKTTLKKTITGLEEGETYYVRVRVRKGKYCSAWSKYKKVTVN